MVNDKEDIFEKNRRKWWDNWWKNRFSVPNDPDSFSFFPGIQFIADKLGINSYKGFAVLVAILSFLVFGIRFGIDWFSNKVGQHEVGQVFTNSDGTKEVVYSFVQLPETRSLIIFTLLASILGGLIIWWFFYRDN